jgi:hypothetical protein
VNFGSKPVAFRKVITTVSNFESWSRMGSRKVFFVVLVEQLYV